MSHSKNKKGVEVPIAILNTPDGQEIKIVKSEGMLFILQPWISVQEFMTRSEEN